MIVMKGPTILQADIESPNIEPSDYMHKGAGHESMISNRPYRGRNRLPHCWFGAAEAGLPPITLHRIGSRPSLYVPIT